MIFALQKMIVSCVKYRTLHVKQPDVTSGVRLGWNETPDYHLSRVVSDKSSSSNKVIFPTITVIFLFLGTHRDSDEQLQPLCDDWFRVKGEFTNKPVKKLQNKNRTSIHNLKSWESLKTNMRKHKLSSSSS